jgi:BirA family transcriptional regulator, biotin operon repressor / biotin---[acetyl-CoA-carboxylase] ligase
VAASPYTDLDRPPLDGRVLRRITDGFWTRVDLRTETASTNADAADAARGGEPEGLVVVAERQTAGRGRLGRTWSSPARAGIATSVLLRPGVPRPDRGWPAVAPKGLGWLPLLAGVALAEAVDRVAELPTPTPPRLKWPNDLLVDGRKVAGILAEAVSTEAVVVGIGLNVTLNHGELPPGVDATSLKLADAAVTDRLPLLRALLRGIETWYGRWRAQGGDAVASGLHAAYEARSGTVGREVRAIVPGGGDITGTAERVDAFGRLVIRTGSHERPIAAGDVLHLR